MFIMLIDKIAPVLPYSSLLLPHAHKLYNYTYQQKATDHYKYQIKIRNLEAAVDIVIDRNMIIIKVIGLVYDSAALFCSDAVFAIYCVQSFVV